MTISKKFILKIILILWIVFSVVYISYDFIVGMLARAYQQGQIDLINALIEEAKRCEPIPIFSNEQRIEVIAIDCLVEAQLEE